MRACATCCYHDGETCHLSPRAEKTSKFYWCKEWAVDWDKTCSETKEEKTIGVSLDCKEFYNYTEVYRCLLVPNHGGDHEFEYNRRVPLKRKP